MTRIKKTSALGTFVYTLTVCICGVFIGAAVMSFGIQELEFKNKALQHERDSLQHVVDSLGAEAIPKFSYDGIRHEYTHSKCTFGHVSEGVDLCKGNPDEWRLRDKLSQDTLVVAIESVLYPAMGPIWFPDMVRHVAWPEYLGLYRRPVCNPFSTVGIEDSCHGTFGSTWPDRK